MSVDVVTRTVIAAPREQVARSKALAPLMKSAMRRANARDLKALVEATGRT